MLCVFTRVCFCNRSERPLLVLRKGTLRPSCSRPWYATYILHTNQPPGHRPAPSRDAAPAPCLHRPRLTGGARRARLRGPRRAPARPSPSCRPPPHSGRALPPPSPSPAAVPPASRTATSAPTCAAAGLCRWRHGSAGSRRGGTGCAAAQCGSVLAVPSSRQRRAGGAASCFCRSARGVLPVPCRMCWSAPCLGRRSERGGRSVSPSPATRANPYPSMPRCPFPERLRAQPFHRSCGQPVPLHHHFGE